MSVVSVVACLVSGLFSVTYWMCFRMSMCWEDETENEDDYYRELLDDFEDDVFPPPEPGTNPGRLIISEAHYQEEQYQMQNYGSIKA